MKNTLTAALLATMTMLSAFNAQAKSDDQKRMKDITPAQREEMAAVHEKMAACLRSDKPIEDCHKEMMQACKNKMGKGKCPMMGKMHGMMHDEDAEPAEAK